MRIALLQLNPVICDFRRNAHRIAQAAEDAFAQGADICITPELAVMGYPPRDLLLNPKIIENSLHAVKWVAQRTANLGPLLLGAPMGCKGNEGFLANGAFLLNKGKIEACFGKTLLPSYDVFDEQRYFTAHESPGFFDFLGRRIGVTICEDIWNDKDFWEKRRYSVDPVQILADQGVDLILNMSASPFSLGKQKIRLAMLEALAIKYKVPLLFCNQVGGNDDLVFDGRSTAVNERGQITAAGMEFEEDVLIVDLESPERNHVQVHDYSRESETWKALVLGIRDYMAKSGFARALLGLSGGIDSALVAAAAATAAGPENVTGVLMPSKYSSPGSIDDSLELAASLGIRTMNIAIESLVKAYDHSLMPVFLRISKDVTEENIQARIRGNLLMALSNKFGWLVLATGNKSELALGYCTIYGDMCGGLAPLSDTPKTLVYSVARWLNRSEKEVIPRQIITKPPSAELSPGQKDRDTLPDYEVLDQILQMHIEQHLPAEEIIARGFDSDTVFAVISMVKKAEFKRRQSPPGIKITDQAFGTGWRMPLASICSVVTKK